MSDSKELANRKLGEDVVGLVGGKDNILSISHCMTRLRFKLRDDSKAEIPRRSSLMRASSRLSTRTASIRSSLASP